MKEDDTINPFLDRGLEDEQRAELACAYFKQIFDDDKGAEAVVYSALIDLLRVVRADERAERDPPRDRD